MKKILIVLLVPLLFACSKDSSNDPVPYTTKYKVGHEYVQTFYRQGSGTQGEIRLLSIDDRLPYEIFPDDEVFAQIAADRHISTGRQRIKRNKALPSSQPSFQIQGYRLE